ncbi:ferredoxin [bacterium DOLZORAL124_64_63]|nr:MAG: ferredoxin [bacterium DOLZORAL124_64_63]
MLKLDAPFGNTLFICTHQRPDGHPKPSCGRRGSAQLRQDLRQMVRDEGLDGPLKIFTSGCLGACARGPVALGFPDGEYMLGIQPEDLPAIFQELKGKVT